ncbi:hypothetical protein TWF569_007143 [Orbilia oligospora]|uniref:Uncharacterized protein n=1 Tax=Orbilia oligospora TaxID=2813651 RepID=A0A7C8NIJ4_ORBOL|nr:hypothetical protein TWF102_004467 [Orbilia oligospora]KAF3087854.1 hypothetical protein TWF706_011030 [Orbilia oligospora]KAF3087855.1 hypothetical protein TWF706_011030 [Orbilia oligospora]KAF3091244.1 hypothetical protein TWF103_011729 [Orbilia oligospora]KAF3129223.1 hypothetical protein TWF594_011073 [Orbilia oligospora]
MSDKSEKIETIENAGVVEVRQTRGQRFKRHCGRRWWIYLIATLLVILALVLGIIFGIIPKIAQDSVNDSTLQVDDLAITNPSNERFTLSMNSTAHSHAPVSAHFSPQTFEMYLPPAEGEQIVPFMTLSVDRLDIKDTLTINVTDVVTEILDKPAYDEFSTQVLNNERLSLGIRSNPEVNVGAIKFKVDYQKTVELKGLNGLKGIELYNPEILEEPLEDGTNMITDGMIPNPSSFTLQVGDLTVDIAVGPQKLGWSVVKDLTLYPGENHVKIYNHITPALLEIPIFLASLKAPNTNITLTANSTVFNGEHIEWLEKPLHDAPPVIAVLNPQ